MTERNTSLRARSGSVTAINSSRKWQGLPELMKFSTLRLILLLGILFIPALSANAEEWDKITCLNVDQELRQSQTSNNGSFATITMLDGAWYYWDEKSNNEWDGRMHFTPTQNKKGEGYGVRFTISVKAGYRITKVIFRDTEGYATYRSGEGLKRLDIENANYSRRWDETSLDNYVDPSKTNKYRDNNNMVFENTNDDPQQSLTFKTHNLKGDQFKCRMIMVICKKVRDYKFTQDEYELGRHVTRYNIFKSAADGSNSASNGSFSYTQAGVVELRYKEGSGYYALAKGAGTTIATITLPSDNDYVRYSASAKFTVKRYDLPMSLSNTEITMNAWETKRVPDLNNRPLGYVGRLGSWTSSDPSVAKVENGMIVFGGTGYGKQATFTAELPGDDNWNPKTLSFTVTVNNEMHIASKADWEQFCNQVNNLNNGGIKATLTDNITEPVTTTAGKTNAPYTGSFDGDNHSIALNLSGGDYTAPFSVADGVAIRNLTVTGNVATSSGRTGSFVGLVQGNAVTIDHCQSSAAITSNSGVFLGGLVGWAETSVNINNCIFSGSMTGANASNCGGLVGWIVTNGKVSSITNCLITAAYSVRANGSNAVAGNAKNAAISKVYILNTLGDIPTGAEKMSEAQMRSGYVARLLQDGQGSVVWGQKINSGDDDDKAPVFSTEESRRVFTSTYSVSENVWRTVGVRYCNPGQTPSALTQQEILDYIKTKDPTHYIVLKNPNPSPQPKRDQVVFVSYTDQEYLSIDNADAWKTFCDYIDNYSPKVSAKMTSDVTLDASSPMVGTKQVYAGRFDGDGHTLTVNYIGTAQATAPFAQAGGAVIENLKTAGTVEQKGTGITERHASGLVGSAFDVTFNNCEVAVELIFNVADQIYSGGFVGHGHATAVTMNNCKFSGKFTGKAGNIVGVAGFVGWSAKTVNISNSYVGGTYTNVTKVHPLVYSTDNPTVTGENNFYCFAPPVDNYKSFGNATQVTADVAKSGSVTYALQHGTDTKGWSQSLPGDNEPMLVFSGTKTVNKVEFVYNNTVKATRYANTGSTLLGGVPTLKDILGGDYNDSYYYEDFSFNPAFNDESVVSKDALIKVSLKYSEYFTINNRVAWEKFCSLVSGGNTKLAAKMTADVIDAVTTMAGTSANPYQGTFDGDGHTLNVNLSGGQNVAPFSVINGATVKNLSVSGTIAASDKYAGSIVGLVQGNAVTIDHCQSSVVISSSVSGDGTHGGLVGLANAPVNINNCIFSGGISGAATNNCGGLVGWIGNYGKGSKITNCLLTAAYSVNANGSNAVARHSDGSTISKVYILNPFGTMPQGAEQVSSDQLKNGYVASLLQEGQQQSVWAFRLGGGTMLHAFSHPDGSEENPNYVYYDAGSWHLWGTERSV